MIYLIEYNCLVTGHIKPEMKQVKLEEVNYIKCHSHGGSQGAHKHPWLRHDTVLENRLSTVKLFYQGSI